MSEIYISVDIETDGPLPGKNSMLSLGAAAFTEEKGLVGTFSVNLDQMDGCAPDPDTMAWWAKNPEAWKASRENPQSCAKGMKDFVEWVESFGGDKNNKKHADPEAWAHSPVFVGYPAGFDFTWVYWYMLNFVDRSPFSFSALDIKTYACATLGLDFRKTTKRALPKRWFSKKPHTHVALDDAIEQGELFMSMRADNLKARELAEKAVLRKEPDSSTEKSASWDIELNQRLMGYSRPEMVEWVQKSILAGCNPTVHDFGQPHWELRRAWGNASVVLRDVMKGAIIQIMEQNLFSIRGITNRSDDEKKVLDALLHFAFQTLPVELEDYLSERTFGPYFDFNDANEESNDTMRFIERIFKAYSKRAAVAPEEANAPERDIW